MANSSRAWQRSHKNGNTEVYAAVNGRVSMRLVGDGDDVSRLIERFEQITGATLSISPVVNTPTPISPDQTTIYDHLGAA